MNGIGTRAVAVILSAAVLVGCSADPDDRGDGVTPPTPTQIPCSANVGGSEPDPVSWTIIDGVVALPSTDMPALQAVEVTVAQDNSEAASTADESWWWAKQGLLVHGMARVELEVPPEHRDELRIGWGGAPATPTISVTLDCDPHIDDWLAFPGGYWVREPGCYPINVRVDDGPARPVHIGIGAPCEGQAPSVDPGAHP